MKFVFQMLRDHYSKEYLTLSLPVTRISVNFSTVYNDTLVVEGLTFIIMQKYKIAFNKNSKLKIVKFVTFILFYYNQELLKYTKKSNKYFLFSMLTSSNTNIRIVKRYIKRQKNLINLEHWCPMVFNRLN